MAIDYKVAFNYKSKKAFCGQTILKPNHRKKKAIDIDTFINT